MIDFTAAAQPSAGKPARHKTAFDDIFTLEHRPVEAGLLAMTAVSSAPPSLASHKTLSTSRTASMPAAHATSTST